MAVYAGLTPPSVVALDIISPADLSMYLSMFSNGLLTNTMFAIPFTMDDCKAPCRSVALPGSLTTARIFGPALNSSLYSTSLFSNSSAIRFDNATGMVIRYEPPPPNVLPFNTTSECIYTGEQVNNGLQICFRQDNLSLLVGWSACPKSLLDSNLCNSGPNPTAWRTDPIVSTTRMSLYRLATTTSYDRSTQAILDMNPLGEPIPLALSANDFTKIFTRALVPSPIPSNTTTPQNQDNIHGINALIHQLTWIHRTYNKTFPGDEQSPISMLQNLLATPVQFAVVSQIYANYSTTEKGYAATKAFPLGEEMVTLARGGEASTMLVILPWAGALFIVVDGVVHALAVGWLAWAVRRGGVGIGGDRETGVAEVDGIRAAERARVRWSGERGWWACVKGRFNLLLWWKGGREGFGEKDGGEGESLLKEVLEGGFGEKMSAWKLARRNLDMRVKEVFKLG